jgi:hypothetical protein
MSRKHFLDRGEFATKMAYVELCFFTYYKTMNGKTENIRMEIYMTVIVLVVVFCIMPRI